MGALYRAFYSFVEAHDLGVVQLAPLPVRLGPNTICEPAVLFVAHGHADRIGEQAYGPPDLVVEVISLSTRQTDRVEKFAEYARAGISEYWLVDPEARTIDVFVLRNGTYELLVKAGPGEKARSQLLSGFEVAVDEVFARPDSSTGIRFLLGNAESNDAGRAPSELQQSKPVQRVAALPC